MFSWSSVWFWVIGCAAVANAAMIVAAMSSRPETIAVARSAPGGSDAAVDARLRFRRSGAALTCMPDGNIVRLSLSGAVMADVAIACERAADARLDRHALWVDSKSPIAIELPARGLWSVRLTAKDAAGAPIEHAQEVMLP